LLAVRATAFEFFHIAYFLWFVICASAFQQARRVWSRL